MLKMIQVESKSINILEINILDHDSQIIRMKNQQIVKVDSPEAWRKFVNSVDAYSASHK